MTKKLPIQKGTNTSEVVHHKDMTQSEAVFTIRASKVSPLTVDCLKEKGSVSLHFIGAHHTLTFSESRSWSVTS